MARIEDRGTRPGLALPHDIARFPHDREHGVGRCPPAAVGEHAVGAHHLDQRHAALAQGDAPFRLEVSRLEAEPPQHVEQAFVSDLPVQQMHRRRVDRLHEAVAHRNPAPVHRAVMVGRLVAFSAGDRNADRAGVDKLVRLQSALERCQVQERLERRGRRAREEFFRPLRPVGAARFRIVAGAAHHGENPAVGTHDDDCALADRNAFFLPAPDFPFQLGPGVDMRFGVQRGDDLVFSVRPVAKGLSRVGLDPHPQMPEIGLVGTDTAEARAEPGAEGGAGRRVALLLHEFQNQPGARLGSRAVVEIVPPGRFLDRRR